MFEMAAARARLAEGIDRCPECGNDCEFLPHGDAFSFEDHARPLEAGDVEPPWDAHCRSCNGEYFDCGPPPCVVAYRSLSADLRGQVDEWIMRYFDEVGRMISATATDIAYVTELGLFFAAAHPPKQL